jgi:4-hydroxybenzoate polyprenyltransferase
VALGGLYPLAKRYTDYPQFVLGMGFNSGIIIGSLAINPQLVSSVIPMYLSGIAWTMIYDTVYAYQVKFIYKIGHRR